MKHPALAAAVAAAIAAVLSAAPLAPATAAELAVTVRGAAGRPAPDVVVMLVPATAAPAPAPRTVDIIQRGNRFEPYVTAVPVGTPVRFVNRDRYDHHVRSLGSGPMGAVPPATSFELRLAGTQAGAKAIDTLGFDTPGSITLGCHIHGSMRGHLFVATTPWVAVTDDNGVARFTGLPEGSAEMRLWHPDQLAGQAAQALTLSGQASASAQLSFNPTRRPAPRPKGEYEF
jgi:plastocyanin